MTFRPPFRSRLLVLWLAVPVTFLPLALHASDEGFMPQFSFPLLGAEALPAVFDSYDLPIAPWADGALPVQTFEGQVDRRAWQLESRGASLLEVLAPLRDQIAAAGYTTILDCEARRCGGFDFRFATDVLPEPGMHVDLNEFRFISARRGDEAVSLMVSRSASAAFVQIITVGEKALPAPLPVAPLAAPMPGGAKDAALPGANMSGGAAPAPFSKPGSAGGQSAGGGNGSGVMEMEGGGMLDLGLPFALDDLVFETGSAALSDRDYASLAALAAWLGDDPARRVILVGHTDISGPLEGNIALSKRRAEAVRAAVIGEFGIAAGRVSAEGAGPLAPRADNATEEGRQKNRRVEAIPAPT